MRLAVLLASVFLLSACGPKIESNPALVFEAAFQMQAPPSGVAAVNGYRLERGRFPGDAMWRLQLSGPQAHEFVHQRWPDLSAATRRSFVPGSQTPWFAPGSRDVQYVILESARDPAVMVMMRPSSEDVFIAYDPT